MSGGMLYPRRHSPPTSRAKRKKRQESERYILQMRAQIDKLERTRVLDSSLLLQTRNIESGSLNKIIREYFNLFRFGLHGQPSLQGIRRMQMAPIAIINKIKQQEHFLHSVMDENAVVGDNFGPNASMEMWRLHTSTNDSIRVEVQRMETINVDSVVIIKVYTHSHCRIGFSTFQHFAPAVLNNHKLMNKFQDREVVYKGVFHFQFNAAGLIASEAFEFDVISGMLESGCSLSDVAELMQYSLAPTTVPSVVCETKPIDCGEPTHQDKLSLKYLLS